MESQELMQSVILIQEAKWRRRILRVQEAPGENYSGKSYQERKDTI